MTLLEHGRDLCARHRGRIWLPLTCAYLAQAYGVSGRIDEAFTTAQQAVALARQYQEKGDQAYAHYVLGGIHALRAPALPDPSCEQFQQSLDLATELGMRPLEAQYRFALGELLGRTGNPAHSRRQLTTAATMSREMGMQFWLEKAESALKKL